VGQHLLTINLEDYFQVGPHSGVIPQRYWTRFDARVENNARVTLDLLDKYGHKATFFGLGWIADQMPHVLKEIAARGHEIASKGYFHRPLSAMAPDEFRADAVRSKLALEKAAGVEVKGYRIAREWFGEKDLWALDVLASEGFAYDSSFRLLGPASRSAAARGKLHLHQSRSGPIWEVPLSSWKFMGLYLPFSGGNYLRQLPEAFMRARAADWDRNADAPMNFYFHVWELDPAQPRIEASSRLSRLRQYRNLAEMPERIEHFLKTYSFRPVSAALEIPRHPVEHPDGSADAAAPAILREGRPKVTIAVPCYNEELAIRYLANTLRQFDKDYSPEYELHYVFVDDGSTDRTFAMLNETFGGNPRTKVVQHAQNCGVAAATMTGLQSAETEIVCVIDCDCSYAPEQLIDMIPMLSDGVDMVTASPYHPKGAVLNVPEWRLFLSRSLSRLYRLVLKHKLATYTACFRVYRRSRIIDLTIENPGYFGITEILVKLDQKGGGIVEYPAVLESRLLGHSKMKIVKTIFGHLGLIGGVLRARGKPDLTVTSKGFSK
jgi:polysaccharide deacetylase family protein (PEP-CTERM system associated)